MPLRETVPGKQFSYSDHDAVSATLSICKTSKVHPCKVLPSFNQTLANGISVCEEALMTLKFSGKKYLFYTVSLFLLLLSTVGLSERTYIDIPRLIIAAALFYFLFMGTLWNYMEWNGVLSGKKGMQILFERLSSCPVNKSDHSDNNLSDNN